MLNKRMYWKNNLPKLTREEIKSESLYTYWTIKYALRKKKNLVTKKTSGTKVLPIESIKN